MGGTRGRDSGEGITGESRGRDSRERIAGITRGRDSEGAAILHRSTGNATQTTHDDGSMRASIGRQNNTSDANLCVEACIDFVSLR